MKIIDIYEKYKVPPTLSRHMQAVARVALFIKNHWQDNSEEIDWEIILKSALLHDLGNIVKFDLEKYPEILRNEGEDVEYWKSIQKEIIEKYGWDDHAATEKMLAEIKVDDKIVKTILNKTFGSAKITAASDDWSAKILLYCDLRVAPGGIETLETRLEELRKRSSHYRSCPDYPELVKAVRTIEKQIQEKVGIPLVEISTESISGISENFGNYHL